MGAIGFVGDYVGLSIPMALSAYMYFPHGHVLNSLYASPWPWYTVQYISFSTWKSHSSQQNSHFFAIFHGSQCIGLPSLKSTRTHYDQHDGYMTCHVEFLANRRYFKQNSTLKRGCRHMVYEEKGGKAYFTLHVLYYILHVVHGASYLPCKPSQF